LRGQFFELLNKYIPEDHSRQSRSDYFVKLLFDADNNIKSVLDLGCGSGKSADYFKGINSNLDWYGIDIAKSTDFSLNSDGAKKFQLFDGIHIPFEDDSLDLIYCNQVFEHVRYPALLLGDVYRVLKSGGFFLGSASQLEPFHALSLWNYTPYGFALLLEEAGLQPIQFRPSIDAVTLIVRRGLGAPRFFDRLWEWESPLNLLISLCGRMLGKNHVWINLVKLLFCGQFSFMAVKPGGIQPPSN
jgi:SAM-dependent methyltransferase